jgi:hypothetical protein
VEDLTDEFLVLLISQKDYEHFIVREVFLWWDLRIGFSELSAR